MIPMDTLILELKKLENYVNNFNGNNIVGKDEKVEAYRKYYDAVQMWSKIDNFIEYTVKPFTDEL